MTGFTTPGIVAKYDFTEHEEEKRWDVYRSTKVKGLDPSDFIAEQVSHLTSVLLMSSFRLGLVSKQGRYESPNVHCSGQVCKARWDCTRDSIRSVHLVRGFSKSSETSSQGTVASAFLSTHHFRPRF
jgi:hypothetical protein